MYFDTELIVNLQNVKDFVESDKFCQFLLANTTEFSTAAFVLQTLLNAVEDAARTVDNTDNI